MSDPNNPNNSNDSSETEIIVAAAALVVSFVAFGATLMQCLQQYYASARGYSQCNEKVMGEWARTKTRHFSWQELRFEVEFDAPVIFVCPPGNQNGPVPAAPIHELDGTGNSLKDTWTTLNTSQRDVYMNRSVKERIHTADNEAASWTVLLSAVQQMENKSREWHLKQFDYDTPPSDKAFDSRHRLPTSPPTLADSHTLVVAVQKKRKSWDTMPPNILKPYATTTMCHLVEMLAAMGVYWRVFDRRADRYRAEGNGFMVLGERMSDLGLLFTFHVNGLSRFERNRVIPVDEIKELCFGWVPTIYRSTHDKRRLGVPIDLFDLSSLRMGSSSEIAETLMIIGCNKNAINHYQGLEGSNGRASHLFNLSFEILGMLSQTFHIPDTFYTNIPNPTPDPWDSRAVSLHLMVRAFKEHFEQTLPGRPRNNTVVAKLNYHIDDIIKHLDEREEPTDNRKTLYRFRALHDAIATADEILTGKPSPAYTKPNNDDATTGAATTMTTENNEKDAKETVSAQPPPSRDEAPKPAAKKPGPNGKVGFDEDSHQRNRRIMVQDVLRAHIQEVLRLLNERDARNGDQRFLVVDYAARPQSRGRHRSPSQSSHQDFGPSFEEMDEASPDERQHKMMEVYFQRVRRVAVPRAKESAHRRQSIIRPTVSRRGSAGSSTSIRSQAVTEATVPLSPVVHPLRVVTNATDEDKERAQIRAAVAAAAIADNEHAIESATASPREGPMPATNFALLSLSVAEQLVTHDDIWCTLVFRMICWLMLHDFSKSDQQIPRSELLGSRMPVYIE